MGKRGLDSSRSWIGNLFTACKAEGNLVIDAFAFSPGGQQLLDTAIYVEYLEDFSSRMKLCQSWWQRGLRIE